MAHRKIGILVLLVLLSLLICPLMSAFSAPKPSLCHNSPSTPPPAHKSFQCCDNQAIRVDQVHATVLLPLVQMIEPASGHASQNERPSFSREQFLQRATAGQLSPPPILRL